MGAYRTLFEVAVSHQYFAAGLCQDLSFEPSAACRAALARAGLLLRPHGHGVSVFYQDGQMERVAAFVADAAGALALDFRVYAGDPHFPEYTLPAARPGQLLFFDSGNAGPEADGRRLLHGAGAAGEGDFLPLDAAPLRQALADSASPRRPQLVVRMVLANGADGLCDERLAPAQRRFGVHFGAGETRWKYYLLGLLGEKQAYIADLDQAVAFHSLGRASVDGRATAAVFLSERAIPDREIPQQRFQLKERTSFGDKVLMKRMPNARAGQRYRDVVDGHDVLVSEIFINQ